MKDETHRRMASDYETIQAIHVGNREIILREKIQDGSVEKYMCAFCQQNELFTTYSKVMYSDNYAEIVKMFGERITEQTKKTRVTMSRPKIQGIDDHPIITSDRIIASYENNLNNKVVVIEPEALCREHHRVTCQLKLCAGGFGAYLRSRGSACFCIDLYTGEGSRYERMDILDIMEPEKLPRRARYGLLAVQQKRAEREQHRSEKEAR